MFQLLKFVRFGGFDLEVGFLVMYSFGVCAVGPTRCPGGDFWIRDHFWFAASHRWKPTRATAEPPPPAQTPPNKVVLKTAHPPNQKNANDFIAGVVYFEGGVSPGLPCPSYVWHKMKTCVGQKACAKAYVGRFPIGHQISWGFYVLSHVLQFPEQGQQRVVLPWFEICAFLPGVSFFSSGVLRGGLLKLVTRGASGAQSLPTPAPRTKFQNR